MTGTGFDKEPQNQHYEGPTQAVAVGLKAPLEEDTSLEE
jgi:hypothetical protein